MLLSQKILCVPYFPRLDLSKAVKLFASLHNLLSLWRCWSLVACMKQAGLYTSLLALSLHVNSKCSQQRKFSPSEEKFEKHNTLGRKVPFYNFLPSCLCHYL